MKQATNPPQGRPDTRRELAELLASWEAAHDPETAALLGALAVARRPAEPETPTIETPPPAPPPAPPKAPGPAPRDKVEPPPQPPAAPPEKPKVASLERETSAPPAVESKPRRAEPTPSAAQPAPAPAEPAPAPAPSPAPSSKKPAAKKPAAKKRAAKKPAAKKPAAKKPAAEAPPTPVRARAWLPWVALLLPALAIALLIGLRAVPPAGAETVALEFTIAPAASAAFEISLVRDGEPAATTRIEPGATAAGFEVPAGTYELYIDRRYTGRRIPAPSATPLALAPPLARPAASRPQEDPR